MIFLDKGQLNHFFRSVSSSFATTPREILFFFTLLTVILLFLIIFYIIQRHRMNRELSIRSDKVYEHLLRQHNLASNEVDLIERLVDFLPPGDSKYMLLTNQHLFNFCTGKLREKDQITEQILASIRLKLGFKVVQPEEVPASSVELPVGMPVLLVMSRKQGIHGRIVYRDALGLTIGFNGNRAVPSAGTAVNIYFHNRAGIFSFPSRILNTAGFVIIVQHSEAIKRYQRRVYFRKKVHLPVFVGTLHATKNPYKTTLLDLGGGGASLGNPDNHFRRGDLLELSFSPSVVDFTVPARVLRTSSNDSVLHVRFESMKESTRDRIIGTLYKEKIMS